MPITIATSSGAVTLKESHEGYEKGSDRGEPFVIKEYHLDDWAKADAVVNAMMGTVSLSGTDVLRVPPHFCPESPNLACLSARAIGWGERTGGGGVDFEKGVIQCRYGVSPWLPTASLDPTGAIVFPNSDNPSQPYTYALCDIDIGSETVRLPTAAYKYATAPQYPLNLQVNYEVSVATLTFVRKFMPYLDLSTLLSKVRKLNDTTTFGISQGKLQYIGAQTRTELVSDGSRSKELALRFKWRENDWNKVLRDDDASWDFIVTDGGAKMYGYDNFHLSILK